MIRVNIPNLHEYFRQWEQLVPRRRWEMMWRKITRYMLKLNRERIKRQENLDHSKFAARKSGKKQKMLRRVLRSTGQGRQVKLKWDAQSGQLIISNPVILKHHYGKTETVKAYTAAEMKRFGRASYKSPCTREQAQELKKLLGKRLKGRPSIAEIRARFKQGQAGLLIKRERGKEMLNRKSWKVQYEERHALGLSKADMDKIVVFIRDLIYQNSQYAK